MQKKLPDIITEEEVRALLEQPNISCPTGLRNRAILEVMVRAGLRVSEVCNLKPGHLRWGSGEIEVHEGKFGKDRVVPISKATQDWLSLWQERRPKKNGYFFTTLKGKPLSPRYLWGMVGRCADKAGIQEVEQRNDAARRKVHPHTLRHTFASNLIENGFTIVEVQQLLGHSHAHSTSVYLHVNPKALREKIQGRQKQQEIAALQEQVAELNERLAVLAAE